MKILKNKYYLFALCIYIILAYAKMNGIHFHKLTDSYLADLLCIPLLLYTSLLVHRYIRRDNTINYNKYMIAFVVIYVSIVFEYFLPKYSTKYTADILDVIMYSIGGIFYAYVIPKETLVLPSPTVQRSHQL